MTLAQRVVRLLVAAWLGAALLFSASVAPAAFAVLPTRSLAGLLVGRVLPVIFYSGALIAVTDLAAEQMTERPRRRLERVLALVMLLACLVAQLAIGPRIDALRERIGPSLDALGPADPRRVTFGELHAASVALLGVAMLSAVVSLALDARARQHALAAAAGRD